MEIDSQANYTNQQYHSKTTYNPSQITNNNKINIINYGGYLLPVSLNSNKGKGRPSNEYTNIKLGPFRGRWKEASVKLAGLKGVKCEIRRKKVLRGIKQRLPLIRTDKQISNQIITIFLDFDYLPLSFLGGNRRKLGVLLTPEEIQEENEYNWNTYEKELKEYLPKDKFLFTKSLSNKIKVIANLDLGGINNIKLNEDLFANIIHNLELLYKLPKSYSDTIDKDGFTCLGIPNEYTFNIIKIGLPNLKPLVLFKTNTLESNTQSPLYCSSYGHFQEEEYESLNKIDPRPVVIDEELEEDDDDYKDINDFDITPYHYFKGDDLPISTIKSRSKLDHYILRILLCTPQLLTKYDLPRRKLAQQVQLIFNYKTNDRSAGRALKRLRKAGIIACVDEYFDPNKAKSYEATGELREYLISVQEEQKVYNLNGNKPDIKIALGKFQKVRNYAYFYFAGKTEEYLDWKKEVLINTPEHKREERRKEIDYDLKKNYT